jgi:hypothetical protein
MAPLTFPSAAYDLVRFFRSSSARQPGLLIAHVDHMRMTSVSSNDGSFTSHLHISRQSSSGGERVLIVKALVSDSAQSRWFEEPAWMPVSCAMQVSIGSGLRPRRARDDEPAPVKEDLGSVELFG